MFKLLREKAKRYLVRKLNRQHELAGWRGGPALNVTFNKVYGLGAKVTSVAEHVTLFNLASLTRFNVIEIGSYLSMSSVIMASGFAPGTERKLFAIDIFARERGSRKGGMDDRFFRNHSQFEFARQLVEDCGLQDKIVLLRGKSSDFYQKPEQFGPTDLVFVDGDHTYEGCRQDTVNFQRLVRPGGFLVFHDFLSPRWPGVRQATEQFLRENTEFTVVSAVDSMLVTRRRG